MISKETQSKLLASRILWVSEPVTEDGFNRVGVVCFAVLALVNLFFWS